MWEVSSCSQASDGKWPLDHLTQAHKNMREKVRASVWIQTPKQAGLAATGPTLESFLKRSRDRKVTHGKKALREVLAPREVLTFAAYHIGRQMGSAQSLLSVEKETKAYSDLHRQKEAKLGQSSFFLDLTVL